MLQLTIVEIIAVKWPKFTPKIFDFGDPWEYHPQKERLSVWE